MLKERRNLDIRHRVDKVKICRYILLLLALFGIPNVSIAADHFVRAGATGANDGSDWTNACPDFVGSCAGSTFVRGETIWVADNDPGGDYTMPDLNLAESGTTVVTIQKATIAAHGTEIGWLDSYGDGQAIWVCEDMTFLTSHWVIDGAKRDTWTSGHGFKLDNQCGIAFDISFSQTGGGTNYTIRYVEVHGCALNSGDGGSCPIEDVVRGVGGDNNVTLQFLYLHDSNADFIQTASGDFNWTLEHSYLDTNQSNATIHGQGWGCQGDDNMTIRFNIWKDIEGTAVIACVNNGDLLVDAWKIYGNVFWFATVRGSVNGMFQCPQDRECRNHEYYNNIILGLTDTNGGNAGFVCNLCDSVSVFTIRNNLWYNISETTSFAGANVTKSHNTALNLASPGSCSTFNEPTDVCTTSGSSNPFVDSAGGDFHLVSATDPGISLSAPFDTDIDGNTRGADGAWDTGAFEFVASAGSTLEPPRNLKATVK